jgi:hypothetical protein
VGEKVGSLAAKVLGVVKARLPFVIATGGEFVALYWWLVYFDQQSYVLATVILWAGFLTERIAVLYWVKVNFGGSVGIAADHKPWWKKLLGLLLICLSEIVVWVTFVFVYDWFGIWAAFAVLLIGEQMEHSLELGLLAKRDWKAFLFTWSATAITILEAVGGIAWLYLVRHGQPQLGGLMILAGLTVEHVVQGDAIRRKFQERQKSDPTSGHTRSHPSTEASDATPAVQA